jgi:hypothetical protein
MLGRSRCCGVGIDVFAADCNSKDLFLINKTPEILISRVILVNHRFISKLKIRFAQLVFRSNIYSSGWKKLDKNNTLFMVCFSG